MDADRPGLDQKPDRQQHEDGALSGPASAQGRERDAAGDGMHHRKSGEQKERRDQREQQVAQGMRRGLAPPQDQEIRRERDQLPDEEELKAGGGRAAAPAATAA